MKAITAIGPQQFVFGELPSPEPEIDGVILDVEVAGVCAADRMLWRGDGPWDIKYPFIPGHEIVGRISARGDQAKPAWKVGERIAVEVLVPCGHCELCIAGRENLCQHGRHFGSDLPGGFAEQIALPAASLTHPIPEEISSQNAAGIETLANAIHAVRRASLVPNTTVAVIGIGAVGGAVIKVIRAAHPTNHLVAIVRNPERAPTALALGAHEAIAVNDSNDSRGIAFLKALQDGRGPQTVIDLSGSGDAVQLALGVVAKGGRVCLYGVYAKPVLIDANEISDYKELDVVGGHLAPDGAFAKAIELLASGEVDLQAIVTHMTPLADFRSALDAPTGLKSVLVPTVRKIP